MNVWLVHMDPSLAGREMQFSYFSIILLNFFLEPYLA